MVREIDGAKVIEFTALSKYGNAEYSNQEIVIIKRLAICNYDNKQQYYLFACDDSFNVLGDTVHNSIEEAKTFAISYYNEDDIRWIAI